MKSSIFTLLALSFTLFCGCEPALHKDTQLLMGSYVEVTSPDPRAAAIVFAEIKRIEGILSKYEKTSEVSRLNEDGAVEAGADLRFVLERSKEFWQASAGAFDITVAPLLDLWGFTRRDFRRPSDVEIKAVLALVGSDKIIFFPENNVVKFTSPGMKIDLGAIAVGYAVDAAIERVRQAGIDSCLINAGGEVYGLGTRQGKPWSVGIKDPDHPGAVAGQIELRDAAVSTSGDYEQYFEEDGRRFTHIIDPATGYPVQTNLRSVTVTARDCLTADALATAVFVLGKEKGLELVKQYPGASARIIEE